MYDKHTGFLMPTAILPRSLTTLGSPSNLLYHRSGLHPDGLPRQHVQMLQWPSACYCVDRHSNPRWGLGYVITTIGPSWEIETENKKFNIRAQFPPTAQGCWFPLRQFL